MVAPASARAVAIVLPSPRAPPVTSATFPSSRNRSKTVLSATLVYPCPLYSLGPRALSLFPFPLSLDTAFLESRRPDPERLGPRSASRNVLQFVVHPPMREVH